MRTQWMAKKKAPKIATPEIPLEAKLAPVEGGTPPLAAEKPPGSGAADKPLPLTSKSVPLVEDLMAPEFFASEAFSISIVQGMVSIAFTSPRYDYSETPSIMKKVVVSRLVMPPAGALNMTVRLFDLLNKNGYGAAPKDPKLRQ
jgi:hypothetical protein